MSTRFCVPYVDLKGKEFMDPEFVWSVFVAAFGTNIVRQIEYVSLGGRRKFKLIVDIVCTTKQALDIRSKVNKGGSVYLDVPFHNYVDDDEVVKQDKWELVKL